MICRALAPKTSTTSQNIATTQRPRVQTKTWEWMRRNGGGRWQPQIVYYLTNVPTAVPEWCATEVAGPQKPSKQQQVPLSLPSLGHRSKNVPQELYAITAPPLQPHPHPAHRGGAPPSPRPQRWSLSKSQLKPGRTSSPDPWA